MHIYRTNEENKTIEIENIEKDSWIRLTNPAPKDMTGVAEICNIPMEFLENSLDLEESARIQYDKESNCTLIIYDFPVWDDSQNKQTSFVTIPIGIILAPDYLVTISSMETPFLTQLVKKGVHTKEKNTLLLQILLVISAQFIDKLKKIDKERIQIEKRLRETLTNKDLYELMEIEKSLVYFLTSLKANHNALLKFPRTPSIQLIEEEKDLLEDVKIENNQAMETTELYTRISDSITNSYASLISNKLNTTMKTLTLFTVFLTLPMIVFSFFGMNVLLPLPEKSPYAWSITIGISVFLILWMTLVLWRRKVFK